MRLWLCPSPRVIKNNGYSNERVLVQKRAGHFSRPSKCWCWKDTKHRLSAGHHDRLCRWEISLCWVKAYRWRERRRRRWSQPVGQICTVSVHCHLVPCMYIESYTAISGQDDTNLSPVVNRGGLGSQLQTRPFSSPLPGMTCCTCARLPTETVKSQKYPFLFLHYSDIPPLHLPTPRPSSRAVLSSTPCSLGCFHCTERLCSAALLHIVCTLRGQANGGNQSTQMRFDSAYALHYNQSSFGSSVSSF